MKTTIVSVLMSCLVLMLASPGWAYVVADYSYDCEVLPSAAGWTDINLEADISIVDVSGETGNKAINWTTLTETTGYVGFNREETRDKTDFTYEIRFKTQGFDTGNEWYQHHLQINTPRLNDVGGQVQVTSGGSGNNLQLVFKEWGTPVLEHPTSYLATLAYGWQKVRITTDWNVAQTEYTVSWFYDDERAAGVGGGDDTTGFKLMFSDIVTAPDINDGTEWWYTGYDKFSIKTNVANPDTHNESIDYIRWVDESVGAGEQLVVVPTILGDVNGDSFVGADDLNIILTNWGLANATRSQGDLTFDYAVGAADYSEVVSNWGNGTPPAEPGEPIPEPATLALLVMSGLGVLLRRRG